MSENKQTNNKIEETEESKKRNPVFWIIVIVISLLIVAAGVYVGRMWYADYASEKNEKGIEVFYSEPAREATTVATELKDNPVDFTALQKTNSDLYAWIKVPGTRVNYPVAQGNDDEFYLHHDYMKNYLFAGTIYTELCNKKDFTDPVTVLYGHNMYASEGTMFTTLHSFEDKAFFDAHKTFYIYTPGHILTYNIFSVFIYDNRHIMNSFDFSFEKDLNTFQDTMLHPHSSLAYVREGAKLDKNSKVTVLSTCCSGDKSVRFLVCGVLAKDERTK